MGIAGIVVLSVLGGLAVLPWIAELIYVISLRGSARRTEGFLCTHLRYLVYITGKGRSGTTTFQAGYANIRTKDLIRRARRKVRFVALAFPEVPFDAVQDRIRDAFERGEIDSLATAQGLLAKGQILSNYAGLSYDNHLAAKPVPFVTLLADYVDAQWALMRNNYVYYYAKAFHSWVTGNDAMDYTPDMLAIKDRALNPGAKGSSVQDDYHLLPYSIICEDEKQLSGKDCTQFMAYAKADSGSADCMRLIGQLGQETIYYTTTNQYWGSDVNRERDLATEIVAMEKSVAINPRFCEMALIRLVEIPARIVLWWRRLRKGPTDPYLVNSKARSFLGRTMDLRKRVASHSFVFFKGRIWHDANDFGKAKPANGAVDQLRAVIPVRYCRGSTNTFEFHSVQRRLISQSRWRLTDEPSQPKDEDLADRVLRKRPGARKPRKSA